MRILKLLVDVFQSVRRWDKQMSTPPPSYRTRPSHTCQDLPNLPCRMCGDDEEGDDPEVK
jgi:hypothetical protein